MSVRERLAQDLLVAGSYILPMLAPGDPRAQQFQQTVRAIENPEESDARTAYLLERLTLMLGDYINPLVQRYRGLFASGARQYYDNG